MIDPNTRRTFATLVSAAFADGRITEDERLVLHRRATEMNVPIRDMNEIIEEGQRGKLAVAVPGTARERESLLDGLIDVVCADGRIEPPEHHLLAKFAGHLKIALPELRQRIKDRMDRRASRTTKVEPRMAPAPELSPNRFDGPTVGSVQTFADVPESPMPRTPSAGPLVPPGPVRLDGPKLVDPNIADIPPVTLQLIKQAISFENDADAGGYIERTLGVPKEEAQRIIAAVLAAFPGLTRSTPPASSRPRR
ncbi:MAG TPA: TerB family tellurite resistance protein [Planctomycetota bacterium]|nr:TerB family tellurite resistance protein [Planctomycetota bacterium]